MQHASAGLVRSGLANTGSLTALLSADHQREVLQLMFRSIVLTTSAIRFEVCVRAIVQRLLGETESKEPTHPESDRLPEMVTIDLPVTLRRRGAGMRIVIDSPYSRPEPDPSLVDLIARAHVYMSRLTGSSITDTRSIASAFGVDRADVGRILPLAFLSPAMLEAILTGRQSTSLTARRLARMDLPVLWADQEAALR
jgi:hypothetical protein